MKQPTPRWIALQSRHGLTRSALSALLPTGAGPNTLRNMWLRRSRAGKVRSRLPAFRWIDGASAGSARSRNLGPLRLDGRTTDPRPDLRRVEIKIRVMIGRAG